MKKSELRIGNLVLRPKKKDGRKTSEFKEVVVESIDSVGINVWQSGYEGENNWEGEFDEDEVKPIPLTEEWLVKFGFTKSKDHGYFLPTGEIDIYYHEGFTSIGNGDLHGTFPVTCVYVHQLQNLTYSLTGEELTLK